MSAPEQLGNLASYSVQLTVLAGTGLILPALLGLRAPRVLSFFLQAVLAACLLLPAAQPWRARELAAGSGSIGASVSAGVAAAAGVSRPGWAEALLAVCAAGVAARLAWLGLGLLRLFALRRRAVELRALPRPIERATHEIGVTARFFVLLEGGGPATYGFRRPKVLLPKRFFVLPPEQQEAIARHELLHVKRRDWSLALAEEVVCSVFWFHPLVWRLVDRIRLVREQIVDALAAGEPHRRRTYVEALLAVAAGSPGAAHPAPAFAGEGHLKKRISLLLKESSMSAHRQFSSLAIAVALVVGAGAVAVRAFPLALAADKSAKVFRVGGGVTAPKLLFKVEPKYSEKARDAKIEGRVKLGVVIDEKGRPLEIRVIEGLEPSLDANAADAVRQWKFQPGMRKGKPVRVQATIEVNFKLL